MMGGITAAPNIKYVEAAGGGLTTLLIHDDKLVEQNLTKIGCDKEWLKNEILKKGISNINDVYAATLDHFVNYIILLILISRYLHQILKSM